MKQYCVIFLRISYQGNIYRFTIMGERPARRQQNPQSFDESVLKSIEEAEKLRDIEDVVLRLADNDYAQEVYLESVDLGAGIAQIAIGVQENLFYQTLEEISGFTISNDLDLLSLVRDLSVAKREYDRIAGALADVKEKGYGIVTPSLEDMIFDEPEIIKRGNQFG